MYSTALITSPMIMFMRRSNLSATAPASGPKISAGSSDVSHTPLTAYAPLLPPSFSARAESASSASQSPRLDSESAIHRRRKGVIDSTPGPRPPKGDLKFTAPAYRHELKTGGRSLEHDPRPPRTQTRHESRMVTTQ